ncbi:hypothetical protein JXX18_22505, partial [Ruthenibacterium lactatiformans]|nr:hypothetical protein [Ruthenibacterium lactatiformans]
AALGAFVLWLTFFITPFHYTDCFSVRQIGYGGTPYYLTFIKFAASALSEKDLGQLLSIAWTQEECPNQDCNVSKRELVA